MSTATKHLKAEELERKRRMLLECDAKIERLKKELAAAKARKAAKETAEAIANAPHANMGLPRDLILLIFEHYISETSMGIRKLRTVCKGWQDIISQTATLWTVIRIDMPAKATEITPCKQFCEECVEKSGELPLEIYIDFRPADIPFADILYEHLLVPMQSVSDDPQYKEEVKRWLHKPVRQRQPFLIGSYQKHFLKPLVALIGDSGKTLARWSSFELHCAQREETLFSLELLGPILQYPAPMLRSLEIHNSGRYVTSWYRLIHPFPIMPQLQHLVLTKAQLPIDCCRIDPLSMKTLRLPWGTDVGTLTCALQCTNLTTWTLCFDHKTTEDVFMSYVDLTQRTFIFPRLRELEIGGNVPMSFWTMVSFPILQHLMFADRFPMAGFVAQDAISIPCVEILTLPSLSMPGPAIMEDIIQGIIRICPALRTMRAVEQDSESILNAVESVRLRGLTAPHLATLALKAKKRGNDSEGYRRRVDLLTLRTH